MYMCGSWNPIKFSWLFLSKVFRLCLHHGLVEGSMEGNQMKKEEEEENNGLGKLIHIFGFPLTFPVANPSRK